ncbi:MAG: peptide ABC transporter substrate-binding protein, partial [Erysipelotrichaceae bacterium]|nr:peptide ABC transporter substrate-binding protein [Erysipelotrichaceae bacterium]
LSMGVFYPARPDFAPEHDYTWGSNPNNPSSGAFYTTKVDLADEVVMAKNPYFYDAANVSIETMTAKVMEDMDAQFMAFQTGEIDFATSVSSDALKTFPADSEEMVVNQSVINYYVLINEYQK